MSYAIKINILLGAYKTASTIRKVKGEEPLKRICRPVVERKTVGSGYTTVSSSISSNSNEHTFVSCVALAGTTAAALVLRAKWMWCSKSLVKEQAKSLYANFPTIDLQTETFSCSN